MDTLPIQTGILDALPPVGRYLTLTRRPGVDPAAALQLLASLPVDGAAAVVGIGAALVHAAAAGAEAIPGLRTFPAWTGVGVSVPSTGGDVWLWLRGTDRGALLHEGRALGAHLSPAFVSGAGLDAFLFAGGRDLSGYEDGTENPIAEDALRAAIVPEGGPGLAGGSFVAVQTWQHDLDRLGSMAEAHRDALIGRRRTDNEELADAPASAHIRRTAQEDFSPPAFVVRRSMPWSAGHDSGLVFVAFGHSFDAFEALLRRMMGLEDGVVDGLFSFTRPVEGAYYFCPPLRTRAANTPGREPQRRLDLRALGID